MEPTTIIPGVLRLRRWSIEHRREVADLVRQSGLSVGDFARTYGLCSKRIARAIQAGDHGVGFAQVEVEERAVDDHLEVRVGRACLVIDSNTDLALLRSVVAVLPC
ncbi:MAG: transposase [Planctomycetota bacterium]|nr:transposase [Planctomycetota bacterium]